MNNDPFGLFNLYKDLADAIERDGVTTIVEDIERYFPDMYNELSKETKRKQNLRKIGALLVGPV
jgi:hypothetical protein